MPRILVVEGNTPEVSESTARVGAAPAAENYAAALIQLSPGIEIRIARPSWPGFSADAVDLDGLDGAALTGSGVSWSADAPEAAPHRKLLSRIFAAGLPVIGSCWGLQIGAVVLGGAVRHSPNGLELGVARHLRLTSAGSRHALHAGRDPVFDAVCIHRDEVARPPAGAVVTASNAHSEVQAMVYETGGVRFWGMQYHPELTLADAALYIARGGENALLDPTKFEDRAALAQVVADFSAISSDPMGHPPLLWRYGVRPEVVTFDRRTAELANWLDSLGAPLAHHGPTPEAIAAEAAL
jgi:GMP synthase (glutamine-hydrolysing)